MARLLLLINPFSRGTVAGAASGIDVYSRIVAALLGPSIELRVIEDEEGLDRQAFRAKVRDIVTAHRPDEVVVEAPESRASTLLVPGEYAVHVRAHCPLALAQYHDGSPIDYDALHEEMAVLRQARLVSAPSHAMARELADALPEVKPLVFRNPPPVMPAQLPVRKDIDVVVLARAQRLKGVDYLLPILRRLPGDFRVLLVGRWMDELRLGRGIRCHVERRPEVLGDERFDLLARARATLVPSRFESFSMVVAESLACGTTAAAWHTAAAELAPPPFVRTAAQGDIDAIARALIAACRAHEDQYPSRQEFAARVELLRDDFQRGARFVLEHAHAPSVPSFSPAPDCSHAHPGYVSPAPVLGRIFRGEAMTSQSSDPFRIRRKLRKLRRDPKAFFRDVRIPMFGRIFRGVGRLGAGAEDATQREPRLIGRVVWENESLVVERYEKKIPEPDLTTAVFSKYEEGVLRQRRFVGELLAATDFIGFSDRYLFVFDYELGGRFTHPADLALLFEAAGERLNRIARDLRNVVFIDPQDILPFLVRATNHDIRLVICATAECQPDLLAHFGHQIDVLITTGDALRGRTVRGRRRVEVESPAQFPVALRRVIIDNRDKEKNLLIPVHGDPGYVEDIDQLNERKIEALLFLDGGPPPPRGNTMRALAESLAERTRALLLSEQRFHQYRDYCERGDLLGLLLASIEDGCRYEVR
jgi:glycosyltransferase involved in cell wall biosynthesis